MPNASVQYKQSAGTSSRSNDCNTNADKTKDSTASDPMVINRSADNNSEEKDGSNDMTTETNISSNIDLLKEFDICFNNCDNNHNNNTIETKSITSNGTYEYDSIELQNESIVKKASIGVADLNNTDSTASIPIKQYDLSIDCL